VPATRPEGAERYVPERRSLGRMREAVQACRGCELWRDATQAVFGEGPAHADLVLVGEQPGDQEDRRGHPFVGPAGRLLDRGLESAGIESRAVYRTNAVKHFKWEPRGKRRIHKSPSRWEVVACGPWLAAELDALTPEVLVLLGATAAQAVFGAGFRVTRDRGRPLPGPAGATAVATVHPSAVLRAREGDREQEMAHFVADLRAAAALLG
jgi:DNA polymerase